MQQALVEVDLPSPYAQLGFNSPIINTVYRNKGNIRTSSKILSETRKALIKSKIPGFSVRELARNCHSSSQTVHQYFGSKDRLISAAVNEYSYALHLYSKNIDAANNTISDFVIAFCRSCMKYPEFYPKIIEGAYFDRRGGLIYKMTHQYGVNMFYAHLIKIRSKFIVLSDYEIRTVSETISTLIGSTIMEMNRGELRIFQLEEKMIFRVNLLLSAISFGSR